MEKIEIRIQRDYEVESRCNVCNEVIYYEKLVELDGKTTKIVQGFWTQELNEDGSVAGPVLPFCPEHSERIKCL